MTEKEIITFYLFSKDGSFFNRKKDFQLIKVDFKKHGNHLKISGSDGKWYLGYRAIHNEETLIFLGWRRTPEEAIRARIGLANEKIEKRKKDLLEAEMELKEVELAIQNFQSKEN